ncbi:hypothetical protein P7K49_012884, partial [Saguinus oedipus]
HDCLSREDESERHLCEKIVCHPHLLELEDRRKPKYIVSLELKTLLWLFHHMLGEQGTKHKQPVSSSETTQDFTLMSGDLACGKGKNGMKNVSNQSTGDLSRE